MATIIINSKWLSKTIEHARFGVNFYLESLGMKVTMLHYCSGIVSVTIAHNFKKLQSNFKMAAKIINSKWLSKTIEHARFWRKFYLESLGMSHNVALLFRNSIS